MRISDFDRLDAHRNLYVEAIIRHLWVYRVIDLSPEDIVVRVILRDVADFHSRSELDIGDYAEDLLVDRIGYVNAESFRLELSVSNFRFDAASTLPASLRRIPGMQRTVLVRRNSGTTPSYISAYFLRPIRQVVERMVQLLSGEVSALGMKPYRMEDDEDFWRELEGYLNADAGKYS